MKKIPLKEVKLSSKTPEVKMVASPSFAKGRTAVSTLKYGKCAGRELGSREAQITA